MEYENWVRKWARWCDIGTFFQQGKLRQGGVVVDRDCTLGLAASDTQEKLFKKLSAPDIFYYWWNLQWQFQHWLE